MSHFPITVWLPPECIDQFTDEALANEDDHPDALADVLDSFEDSASANSSYMEFTDREDEWRAEYPDRAKAYPFQYRSVEDYLRKRYSSTLHNGRYGDWRNTQGKWDWYVVGGRWSGDVPIKFPARARIGRKETAIARKKTTHSDVVQVREIDFDRVAEEEALRFEKFKHVYREMIEQKDFVPNSVPWPFYQFGIARREKDPQAAIAADEVSGDKAFGRYCVLRVLTDDQLARYRSHCNPLVTWAFVDARQRWHEAPGMWTWDNPDACLAFADTFVEKFIKPCDPDDVLVLVDCHV